MFGSVRRGAFAVALGFGAVALGPIAAGADPASSANPTVSAQLRQDAGDFVPLSPVRILDTRVGIGAPAGILRAGDSLTVTVSGVGGIPGSDVVALFVNLTVTGSDYDGSAYVTSARLLPDEIQAETVVFRTGKNVPNMALVPVQNGQIVAGLHEPSVFSDGSAHLVVDVAGYVTTAANPSGSRMVSVAPSRILDTREGNGLAGPLGAGSTGTLPVKGRGGVPANASAVLLNLTGVTPTATTYVTAYPGDQATPPTASNLNLEPGQIAPNVVVVQLPADGTVKLFNYAGTTHLVADVIGYFVPAAGVTGNTGKIGAHDPRVMADPTGLIIESYAPGAVHGWFFPEYDGVAGLFFNLVAVSDSNGYMTVFPDGSVQPVASNLNLSKGVLVSNLVAVATGPGAGVRFYNFSGNTNLFKYILGYVLA